MFLADLTLITYLFVVVFFNFEKISIHFYMKQRHLLSVICVERDQHIKLYV